MIEPWGPGGRFTALGAVEDQQLRQHVVQRLAAQRVHLVEEQHRRKGTPAPTPQAPPPALPPAGCPATATAASAPAPAASCPPPPRSGPGSPGPPRRNRRRSPSPPRTRTREPHAAPRRSGPGPAPPATSSCPSAAARAPQAPTPVGQQDRGNAKDRSGGLRPGNEPSAALPHSRADRLSATVCRRQQHANCPKNELGYPK